MLRPGGALVVANNEWRTDAAPWLAAGLPERAQRAAACARRAAHWRRVLEASELFEAPCEAAKPHEQVLSHEAFIDLSRSLSSVNVAGARRARRYLAGAARARRRARARPLVVPFRTRAVAARRRG